MSFDIDDSSYLWGDGLFETMQVREGRIVALTRHLTRMQRSLDKLDYPMHIVHVEGHLEPEGLEDGLLRITVSRSGRITTRWRARTGTREIRATVMMGWYDPSNVLAQHKTTSYLKNLEMKRRAVDSGFDDAIGVSSGGRVGEASMSNILVRLDDTLVTPTIEGLLPGITRERILHAASLHQVDVQERELRIEELSVADAVVVTSSGVGASPVVSIDDMRFEGSVDLSETLNGWLEEVE